MKRYIGKYLVLLGGLLALAPMSGCKLDDPEIPVEELYLRNFIKKYGLIDPTQDFSSAKQVNVTLNIPDEARLVNIYAQVGDDYYRVGCFADLGGTVTVPVDVSEATETMMVDVDGVRYYTEPNGTVDVISGETAARSRSLPGEDIEDLKELWIEDWDNVTKTNGETSDYYASNPGNARKKITISNGGKTKVDGSEIKYFSVKDCAYVGGNLEKTKFDKIEGSKYTKLGEIDNSSNRNVLSGAWCYNAEEVGNTHLGTNIHFRIVNNDDKLSAYKFTFRTASRNNAKVRVAMLGKYKTESGYSKVMVFMDSKNLTVKSNYKGTGSTQLGTYDTSKPDQFTEWEIRTDVMPEGEYQLIIMGMESTPNTVTNQEYCGNWGFMTLERLKTATDMRWILACEDLGTTDDFDFNDVVFSIEAVNTNKAAISLGVAQWQVIEVNNDGGFVLHPDNSRGTQSRAISRDGENTGGNTVKTQVRVTALAAGGMLPIWLHYRETNGTDYLVCPGCENPLQEVNSIAEDEVASDNNNAQLGVNCNEWHRWFVGHYKSSEMLNTGYEKHAEGRSVIFYTNTVFTLENFCYIQYAVNSADGYKPLEGNQDPWAEKVNRWLWIQENSQAVTYGFFLTVYHPLVGQENPNKGSKGHILLKTTEGLPPQMFLIPDCNPMRVSGYESDFGWKWPCERVDITSVYPQFKAWVENKDSYAGSNWFMLPNPGIVDKDYKLYPRDPALQENFEWKNGDEETPSFNK